MVGFVPFGVFLWILAYLYIIMGARVGSSSCSYMLFLFLVFTMFLE